MNKFISIKAWRIWIVLLYFVISFIGQSYGGDFMSSSKKMEEELRQAVIEASHRFKWRTETNGGIGHLIRNFPEGKIIADVESAMTPAVSLSPDATQIALFQDRFFNKDIHVLVPSDLMIEDINKGMRKHLGLSAFAPVLLAFSPNGEKLALIAEEASLDLQPKTLSDEDAVKVRKSYKLFIFFIAEKILESFDVLHPEFFFFIDNDQIWSPNGDEILYLVSHNKKPPLDFEIRILSLVTKTTRSLSRGCWPAWSPVRNKIIFQDEKDKNYYLINSDGSSKKLLVKTNPKDVYDLIGPILWSPDGRWLLLSSRSFMDSVDLYVMDIETKVMVKIESQTGPRTSWKGRYQQETPGSGTEN